MQKKNYKVYTNSDFVPVERNAASVFESIDNFDPELLPTSSLDFSSSSEEENESLEMSDSSATPLSPSSLLSTPLSSFVLPINPVHLSDSQKHFWAFRLENKNLIK